MHRFYGSLRRIRNFPTGRCRHRPVHSSRRLHLLFTIFRAEQARQGRLITTLCIKIPFLQKAVTEVTFMANNEKFRYDPTPMNHEFPGQPDDCFDVVNQYGTSQHPEDRRYRQCLSSHCARHAEGRPLCAPQQGNVRYDRWRNEEISKNPVERIALRRIRFHSHVSQISGQYPAVACLPFRTMGVRMSSG